MKTITLTTLTAIALVGCGGGDTTPTDTATTPRNKSVVIKYQDGQSLGVTCGEYVASNGVEGMNICDIGTGSVVGFVKSDATVTNLGGEVIGECSPDFDISRLGEVNGNCGLSISKPSNDGSSSSTSNTSGGTSGNEVGVGLGPDAYSSGSSTLDTGNQGAPAVLR